MSPSSRAVARLLSWGGAFAHAVTSRLAVGASTVFRAILLIVLCQSSTISLAQPLQYRVYPLLERSDVPNPAYFGAVYLTNDGQIAYTGRYSNDSGDRVFYTSIGTVGEPIDIAPNIPRTQGLTISTITEDGTIIGTYSTTDPSNPSRAYAWSKTLGFRTLGGFPPNTSSVEITAVNKAGRFAGIIATDLYTYQYGTQIFRADTLGNVELIPTRRQEWYTAYKLFDSGQLWIYDERQSAGDGCFTLFNLNATLTCIPIGGPSVFDHLLESANDVFRKRALANGEREVYGLFGLRAQYFKVPPNKVIYEGAPNDKMEFVGVEYDKDLNGRAIPGTEVGWIWTKEFGRLNINTLISPQDPLHGQINVYRAAVIANSGLIAAHISPLFGAPICGNQSYCRAVLVPVQPSYEVTVELFDPDASLIVKKPGSATGEIVVTGDAKALAGVASRPVSGVAADGVATLLLRIKGAPNSQVSVQVQSAIAPQEDGFLGLPGGTPNRSSEGTTTDANGVAYVLYRAPLDFSWRPDHYKLKERKVTLSVVVAGVAKEQVIDVVRPLVVFTHGLWATKDDLVDLPKLIGESKKFTILNANYGDRVKIISSIPPLRSDVKITKGSSLGISHAAKEVSQQLIQRLDHFRNGFNAVFKPLSAGAVDIVGHSMGALVARDIAQYSVRAVPYIWSFGRGYVHKIISIGGPHLGSPIAGMLVDPRNTQLTALLNAGDLPWLWNFSPTADFRAFHDCDTCVYAELRFSEKFIGSGAIGDLAGSGTGSTYSRKIKSMQLRTTLSAPTAYLGGVISSSAISAFDEEPAIIRKIFAGRSFYAKNPKAPLMKAVIAAVCKIYPSMKACWDFASSSNFKSLLTENSDGLVPLISQLNGLDPKKYELPPIQNAAHSVWTRKLLETRDISLGDELDSLAAERVWNLLNTPVNDKSYVK